jgi:hypothetical protein
MTINNKKINVKHIEYKISKKCAKLKDIEREKMKYIT